MEEKQHRQDGFSNVFLGGGLKSRDPLASTRYEHDRVISDQELASMYNNGLVRRIIDLPAEEAVKNWVKVCGDEEEDLALQMLDDLNAEEHIANALRWSRLFGGGAILLTVNDGGTMEDELRENNIQEVEALRVFDKREVIINEPMLINDDPYSKSYGLSEWIQFNPANGTMFYAHRSRVLIFDGDPLPNRERINRNGWGLPVLQGLFTSINNNDDAYRIGRMILERMSQSVTKFDGLMQQLETEEGEELVKTRLQLVDMARSILNTVALDKEDEFQLFNMSLSNVPELIDRFGMYVAALSSIPYTLLFGRNTSGLNANDQSQLENFYSFIRRLQKRKTKSNLDKLVRLLTLSKNGLFHGAQPNKWNIEFNPLWMPSKKEQAETNKLNADTEKAEAETIQIYNNVNALDGTEARQYLKDQGKYPIDSTLDMSGEVIDDETGKE